MPIADPASKEALRNALTELSASEINQLVAQYGLPASGTKAAKIDRIVNYTPPAPPTPATPPATPPTKKSESEIRKEFQKEIEALPVPDADSEINKLVSKGKSAIPLDAPSRRYLNEEGYSTLSFILVVIKYSSKIVVVL